MQQITQQHNEISHFRYRPPWDVVLHTPEGWSGKANLSGNAGKPDQSTRLLQLTAISLPQHHLGVVVTVVAKLLHGAMGAASPWPRQLQHPFLHGSHAWRLPNGLDFSMPSLCTWALNIKQWPSYLFPQGLISLFKRSSSTKCKELSAAQLMQSSPKSQQPCTTQIFVGY